MVWIRNTTYTAWMRVLSIIVLVLFGCGDPTSGEPDDMVLGQRFVDDQSFRRQALVDALVVTDNTYAQTRLENYAVAGGWDELPEAAPTAVVNGEAITFEPVEWTHEAVTDLGRRAFNFLPMRGDPRFSSVELSPAEARVAGFYEAAGEDGGLVRTSTGELAWTCATCHSSSVDGQFVPGRAKPDVDVAALYRIAGRPNATVETWGPGRIDPSDDQVNNPSNIPDLRVVRFQDRLHWTGGVQNSLEALAIRVDTLLIVSSYFKTRPPRQVSFAIAYYLWSLAEDHRAPTPPDAFLTNCARCHGDGTHPNGVVPWQEIGTDPTLAESPSRGTGGYRVPTLAGVATRGRLTHTGQFATPSEMFESGGHVGAGHPFADALSIETRREILTFLRSAR
ncbi:MAG: hypothetical protein R3E66_05805 [bacterium]